MIFNICKPLPTYISQRLNVECAYFCACVNLGLPELMSWRYVSSVQTVVFNRHKLTTLFVFFVGSGADKSHDLLKFCSQLVRKDDRFEKFVFFRTFRSEGIFSLAPYNKQVVIHLINSFSNTSDKLVSLEAIN